MNEIRGDEYGAGDQLVDQVRGGVRQR